MVEIIVFVLTSFDELTAGGEDDLHLYELHETEDPVSTLSRLQALHYSKAPP